MVKYVAQEESIEGERVLVNTRKQIVQPPVSKGGKILTKYLCSKNAQAEIKQELNPKIAIVKKASRLDLGDILEAHAIEVFTTQRLHFKKEANFTSVHGIQTAECIRFTFAEISVPFRFVLQRALSNT